MTFSLFGKMGLFFSSLTEKKGFWWMALTVLLLPFCILVFFNHPSADDYCYVVDVYNRGFWQSQWATYNNWTGRYTSTFLLNGSPILWGSFMGYKFISFLLLILTTLSCLFFVKTILNKKDMDVSVIAVSFCLLFIYLVRMPTLTQGFYWLSGAITYQLANIATITVITVLLNLRKNYNHLKLFTAVVLCIMICGLNETSMLEWLYILCAMMTFEYASTNSVPRYYYMLLAVSLIGAAIIVGAPGNTIRSAGQGQKDIVKLLFCSGEASFMRIQEWLQDIVILLVLFLPFLKKANFVNDQRKINLIILTLYPLFIVGILVIGYFPAFWSIGFEPPLRTINVLYLIFSFSCLHYVILWVIYIRQNDQVFIKIPQFILWILLFIVIRDLAPQNNLNMATMDIVSGRVALYDQEMEERYTEMKKNEAGSVVFKPFTAIPASIFFEDIEAGHPEHWKNLCMSDYFHLKSLDLSKPAE